MEHSGVLESVADVEVSPMCAMCPSVRVHILPVIKTGSSDCADAPKKVFCTTCTAPGMCMAAVKRPDQANRGTSVSGNNKRSNLKAGMVQRIQALCQETKLTRPGILMGILN